MVKQLHTIHALELSMRSGWTLSQAETVTSFLPPTPLLLTPYRFLLRAPSQEATPRPHSLPWAFLGHFIYQDNSLKLLECGDVCAPCLCEPFFWKSLGFSGCLLSDCAMSRDGFVMPPASQHPVVSNARLVVGTGGRAGWSLGEASHYFRLGAF